MQRDVQHNRTVKCHFCGTRRELGTIPCCNPHYVALASGPGKTGRRFHPHNGLCKAKEGSKGTQKAAFQRRQQQRMVVEIAEHLVPQGERLIKAELQKLRDMGKGYVADRIERRREEQL